MSGSRIRMFAVALALAAATMGGAAVSVVAQESPADLAANIFQGSCANLNSAPLRGLNKVTPNDPRIGGSFSGAKTATGVLTSETDIRLSLSTLLNQPHAIVIGDPTAPVACGDIGGFTRGIVNNDDIEIGLASVGDSGVWGIADIEGDGNEVEIDLYVAAPFR